MRRWISCRRASEGSIRLSIGSHTVSNARTRNRRRRLGGRGESVCHPEAEASGTVQALKLCSAISITAGNFTLGGGKCQKKVKFRDFGDALPFCKHPVNNGY
jgi:hypothetical protein